jgi:RNA polymerase sigma-70 factor (ECF subfamily)
VGQVAAVYGKQGFGGGEHSVQNFHFLYQRSAAGIRRFFACRTAGGFPVDDCVQETFARAWEKRDCLPHAPSGTAYLMGIARNVLHEQLRAARRSSALSLDACPEPAGTSLVSVLVQDIAAETPELRRRLADAKAGLSPSARSAIELVYVVGLSAKEAAKVAGCSYPAFRQRLSRAMRHLRQSLTASASQT